ncbi:hypothetical protein EJ110_NYTH30844 [Nymphaea thermarum]|nr:hypothetical protein EJ110_NYTH30844 [Nymphaea thermarum]
MAFERMHPKLRNHEVTSYVSFMVTLIDTAEDVCLLCSRGIVNNLLGSDEHAANVFNKMGDGIVECLDDELYDQLQSYVASDWNAFKAYLKRNYFQNPWSGLSLLAAVVMLVLTFIQTLFSVLAVENDTAEDVSILGKAGIVTNNLGSDEAAANIFSKLGIVEMCSPFFEVMEEVVTYASVPRHHWWPNFKRTYLANPWTILSLTGAFYLLFLATVQTKNGL